MAEFIMKCANVATKPNKHSRLKSSKFGMTQAKLGIRWVNGRVANPARPTARVCNVIRVNPLVLLLKNLVRVSIKANVILPPSAISAGNERTALLGGKMTITPKKPIPSAAQRRTPTCSCKMITENAVKNNGDAR